MINSAKAMIDNARRIVAFSGAGLSAESGVPTFRDAGTSGFWVNYDPTKLASPEGFADDPQLVYRWYNDRRRSIAAVEPNPAHHALAGRPDIVNVTQNIDDLLARAGATRIIGLHGTLAADRCHAGCGYEEAVDLRHPPSVRRCPRCGAWMRPSVVWFGEVLPAQAWSEAEQVCLDCDVLIVVGTSAEVYPAAGLIGLAKGHGAGIIVVNPNPSQASVLADCEVQGLAGEVLPTLLERRAT